LWLFVLYLVRVFCFWQLEMYPKFFETALEEPVSAHVYLCTYPFHALIPQHFFLVPHCWSVVRATAAELRSEVRGQSWPALAISCVCGTALGSSHLPLRCVHFFCDTTGFTWFLIGYLKG
jgi:hypothetical protein